MTPTWRRLKPVGEYVTGLYPYNRWGMVYVRAGGGSRCLACQQDVELGHNCPWEDSWRLWSGRHIPIEGGFGNPYKRKNRKQGKSTADTGIFSQLRRILPAGFFKG